MPPVRRRPRDGVMLTIFLQFPFAPTVAQGTNGQARRSSGTAGAPPAINERGGTAPRSGRLKTRRPAPRTSLRLVPSPRASIRALPGNFIIEVAIGPADAASSFNVIGWQSAKHNPAHTSRRRPSPALPEQIRSANRPAGIRARIARQRESISACAPAHNLESRDAPAFEVHRTAPRRRLGENRNASRRTPPGNGRGPPDRPATWPASGLISFRYSANRQKCPRPSTFVVLPGRAPGKEGESSRKARPLWPGIVRSAPPALRTAKPRHPAEEKIPGATKRNSSFCY